MQRLTFVGDEDRDDETVDGNDTSHDNGNHRLHDEVGPHDTHGCDSHTTLSCAICCPQTCVEDGAVEREMGREGKRELISGHKRGILISRN